jgi:hypothetical protein
VRAVVVAALALVLVASAPAALPNPCRLLTNAEVAKVLGTKVAIRVRDDRFERACVWSGPTLGPFTSGRPEVRLGFSRRSRKQFEQIARSTTGTPVRGIGDEALWLDGNVEMLWFWSRGLAFTITLGDVQNLRSPVQIAKQLALAALTRTR